MMRMCTAIFPLAFFARAHAQGAIGNLEHNLLRDLLARTPEAALSHHIGLENTMSAKSSNLAAPHRAGHTAPLRARSHRHYVPGGPTWKTGYHMLMHRKPGADAGVRASRRTFLGGAAGATVACNLLQCGLPLMAIAASGDSDRLAGQGDQVLVQYKGTFQDGTVFDSSEGKDPLSLIVGGGQVVKGFDNAIRGMKLEEKKTVTLPPDQAYGVRDENMVFQVPKQQAPPGLKPGERVGIGQGMTALVAQINGDGSIVLDANPALAGKTLVFDIELLAFNNPPLQGISTIGWHGKQIQVPFGRTGSAVSKVFEKPKWPAAWPYTPADFKRQDESTDTDFYDQPRFVTHIDNGFIGAISSFYDLQFSQAPQGEYSVLDLCSSWVSHYPAQLGAKRVAITGMNVAELKANKQATEYVAKDLNVEPKLPYGENEFDFVTNVVSVDYLNKPQEIFREMHRVMKPGGVAIMSFSNRCFATKAISMWVANMNDGPGHCQIVGNYFRFNPDGGWKDISSVDISPNPGRSDPVWVVTAVKA